MRQLKTFLILVIATTAIVALLQLVHAFTGLGAVWQGLIQATSLKPASMALTSLLIVILIPASLWVGLGSSLREMLFLSVAALLLLLGGSLVSSLYGSYLNPVP